jgi:hypothetical protein
MVMMTSSLRFATSVKLMVPDQVPAKRSAGLAGVDGAQALTDRPISIMSRMKEGLVFIVFLFLSIEF